MALSSINPSSGEVLESFEEATPAARERVLAHAWQAFLGWRARTFAERAARLREVARVLRAKKMEYARLMAREMGKPVAQGDAEVEKCAWGCDYYAEHAARFLAPEPRETDAARSYVTFDPLGPVLAVMPWNFPFWQVFRFAAPTIVAGNVALLKHAVNVSGAALAIESVWRDAGAPDGVFQTLLVPSGDVAALIADDRVRAVTLTGSERAGTSVAENAGRVCKKCVLELGGSDPFIVLADADPVRAAHAAVKARVVNSGQSCIAAKRFIAVGAVADPFTRAFADAMRALRVGDPRDAATDVGPLARGDLRDELVRQIDGSLAAGARRLVAPATVPSAGFFFPPTVLADVHPGMPAFDEEVFGPVAAVVIADSDADAIALANRSRYGLGGSIWTRDTAHAEALAHELDCGMVFVNDLVRSDPRLPFGGVKRSGYGRELSHYGIHEFVNVRTVVIGGEGRTDRKSVVKG